MGVNLKDLVVKKKITLADLSGKKLAVDAYNQLYMFLSSIRQRDGTPLKDSKGNITSHLSGLFYRTSNLLEAGVLPCFVFDGAAPELKAETQEQRRLIKVEAEKKYKEALEKGEMEAARKWAQQTSKLTPEMVSESKKLLDVLGIPWVQAIAEGEAQAAYMTARGWTYAVASQDFDALLFGTPKLVRNISITGKRKLPGKAAFVEVQPEEIDLVETLNALSIDKHQLIQLAILIGTDYNAGIKGVGPYSALRIVKEGKFNSYAKKIKYCDRIQKIFLNPPVVVHISLEWRDTDPDKIKQLLCAQHDFSEQRVDNTLKKLESAKKGKEQESLRKFL